MGSSPPRGSASKLFTPLAICNGKINLSHRVIMAPMTRNRGIPLNESTTENPNRIWVADELIAKYYGQRATPGGLLVTESIMPSPEAGGMPGVPGLWLKEHGEGWKLTTKAVHSAGGIIFAQLTHHGRCALSIFTSTPIHSASATPYSTDEKYAYPAHGKPYSDRVFMKDHPPTAMTKTDIERTIKDYVSAARMAVKESGFDGVELHAGNGYLVEQFLSSNVNIRTDEYGGSPEKRCRFALEVLEGLVKEVGMERVAVRFSPWGVYGDVHDEARFETWSFLCREIARRWPGFGYVSFVEARQDELDANPDVKNSWGVDRPIDLKWAKEILGNIKVISAGGWDGETCWEGIERGDVDGIVFARWFVSNPDLVERLRGGKELSMYNRGKFYGPTSKREVGYTDYGTWEEVEAARECDKTEV
ncbi:12-oxophytodienoate reductase [Mollisia scopiformis]|uniref:12-oxophytodienoate reductase n=1 Tax=Mollisia scopiformis TaxID=149040 RepID=A0A132BAG7_MOLSC|nr:12-oxophytodienoate reductase [Mollisia scopiformis]KUJ09405.1 12-oxophytodienoate reductase [Mollisia scopiformis]